MKRIFLFLFIPLFLFGYRVEIKEWGSNTFLGFLKKNHIPVVTYYKLNKKIKKQLATIPRDMSVLLLKNGDTIKQALIPFNEKQELQLIKTKDGYLTKVLPLNYETEKQFSKIIINNFLSYDVYKTTKNPYLTSKLIHIFKPKINFKKLPKNTEIEVFYKTKRLFGKVVNVDILFARIKNRYYDYSAYKFNNRYYDSKATSLTGMFLPAPLRYTRISSPFGMRFHPILHKWRMHDGIDYVNKIGTPIHAIADGKIVYKGWMRGYGRVVEIQHSNGFLSLYGHLHKFGNIKLGEWVKQGKVIAFLGNTGLSTGPHLHFGLMHNRKWVNPKTAMKSVKVRLYGKNRKRFIAYMKNINYRVHLEKVAMK